MNKENKECIINLINNKQIKEMILTYNENTNEYDCNISLFDNLSSDLCINIQSKKIH